MRCIQTTWQSLAGNWDGAGGDWIGLYDQDAGAFRLKNSHGGGASDLVFSFGPAGNAGFVAIAGDQFSFCSVDSLCGEEETCLEETLAGPGGCALNCSTFTVGSCDSNSSLVFSPTRLRGSTTANADLLALTDVDAEVRVAADSPDAVDPEAIPPFRMRLPVGPRSTGRCGNYVEPDFR